MEGMTTTTLAQMDRAAHAAAARHRAGELDETDLRRELAEMLVRSGEVAKAANRFLSPSSHYQLRADLTEELSKMEIDRVLTHPGFEPWRMTEASFSGWLRKRLWRDAPDVWRQMMTRTADKMVLTDDVSLVKPSTSVVDLSTDATQIDPAVSVAEEGVAIHLLMMEAHEQWKATATSRREETRDYEAAQMLMQVFGLPRPIRPLHRERVVLTDYFARRPEAIRASLTTRLTREPVTGTVALAQSLWDDYTDEHIEVLLAKPARATEILVAWATEDRPLPVETIRRSFFATVRALGSGEDWRQLGGELAAAHLALEYTANCVHDHDAERRAAREIGRTVLLEQAGEVMARVIARCDHPLGRTETDVRDRLEKILEDLR